jgi:uncharacterized Zn-binding protein involved in type VI secretion
MVMRNWLCVGDQPITGGAVLPYSVPYPTKVHGRDVALINGKVYCEACKSTGIIIKAGGPRRLLFEGEAALDGDLCLCKCSPPPPIKATHALTEWFDDDHFGGETAPIKAFDEQIRCMTEDGHIIANMPYVVTLDNGDTHQGVTDEHGRTERIYHDEPRKVVKIDFNFPKIF